MSRYRLQTIGDFIFMGVVATLVLAMGVLMLLFPLRPLPIDPAAYETMTGLVDTVWDRSARRASRVHVRLRADDRVFEIERLSYRDEAAHWTPGRTQLSFQFERHGPDDGSARRPIPALGLSIDGRPVRSLAQDIEYSNSRVSPWGGVMALSIGALCLVAMGLAWRRRVRPA